MPDTDTTAPAPLIKRAAEVEYETVEAADGLRKGVLVGEAEGAPNFALRRFVLDPGATVPKHTNTVEHEQHVLEGEYVVGTDRPPGVSREDGETVDGGVEHVVSAGDSLLIPAGTVHWYRNEGNERGVFLCAVPDGDDEIRLTD